MECEHVLNKSFNYFLISSDSTPCLSAWNKLKNIKHDCVKVDIGILLEFSNIF